MNAIKIQQNSIDLLCYHEQQNKIEWSKALGRSRWLAN